MKLVNLSTSIYQRYVNISFNKRLISLRGNNATELLHILASLLVLDFTGNFRLSGELKWCVPSYKDSSVLTTDTAMITGKDNTISVAGILKNANIVYYTGANKVASCYIGNDDFYNNLKNELTLVEKLRLIKVFNNFVGYEALYLDNIDNSLQTDFLPVDGMDETQLQLILDIFTFILSTDSNSSCIVLLHSIPNVPMERLIQIILSFSVVTNIITTVEIDEHFFDKSVLDIISV